MWGVCMRSKRNHTVVINITDGRSHPDYVYIGRPSIWGNPFLKDGVWSKFEKDCERVKDPVKAYEMWLVGTGYQDKWQDQRKIVLSRLKELRGQVLGCFCKPRPCHGDVLATMVDNR